MALLNYSTSIDVHKTLGEIQGLLAKSKARSISIDYQDGEPSAVSFVIETPIGLQPFRLPMDGEAIFKTITKQYQRGQVQRRFVTRDQAARVGWRIIKDWLAAQIAIVETEMVSISEVMLPYLVGPDDKTLYQAFISNQLALPAAQGGR